MVDISPCAPFDYFRTVFFFHTLSLSWVVSLSLDAAGGGVGSRTWRQMTVKTGVRKHSVLWKVVVGGEEGVQNTKCRQTTTKCNASTTGIRPLGQVLERQRSNNTTGIIDHACWNSNSRNGNRLTQRQETRF